MANRRACSLSRQDCDALYPFRNTTIPYTSESCVPYIPWFTDDVGICGWVGAPCRIRGNGSNCNNRLAGVCIDGVCGAGLGSPCGNKRACNGVLRCGDDGICGGDNAPVLSAGVDVRQLCVTGKVYSDDRGMILCTTRTPRPTRSNKSQSKRIGGIVGGTLAGLAVLSALIFWFWWYRRRSGKPFLPFSRQRSPSAHVDPFVVEPTSVSELTPRANVPVDGSGPSNAYADAGHGRGAIHHSSKSPKKFQPQWRAPDGDAASVRTDVMSYNPPSTIEDDLYYQRHD